MLINHTMQFFNRHIVIFGRLFLVVFVLATSGFSIAVSHCTMGSSDAGACTMTGMEQESSGDVCHDDGIPQTAKGTVAASNAPCMVTTVAGGLQTEPTTFEKESLSRHLAKIDLMPLALPALANAQILEKSFTLFSSAGSNVSPPSVEKYVLNATFLI